MNVIVIAPHPDDESIGCGGTICKHVDRGDRVVVVFLTSGELGLKHLKPEKAWGIREAEARKAAKILGIADVIFLRGPDWTLAEKIKRVAGELRGVLQRENPGLIYLPHPREWHPDHAATIRVLRIALTNAGKSTPKLRGYEVWTPLTEFDHVEDISAVMPRKVRAVRAHRSQVTQIDYAAAARGLNAYRGALSGKCRYAEVFQTIVLPTRGSHE
jgi:LmbE family N-acetylglucosaminyl deacetylase